MKTVNFLVVLLVLVLVVGNLRADGVKPTYELIGKMDIEKPPIKSAGVEIPPGVTINKNIIELSDAVGSWKGHWDAGQFKLPENGRIILKALVENGIASVSLMLYGGKMLPKPDRYEIQEEKIFVIWNIKPNETPGTDPRSLSAFWLDFRRKESGPSKFEIVELSLWKTVLPNE